MNCQIIRNRILAVEDLNQLPDELTAHVGACSDCLAWRLTFLAVNQSLARLPVPATDGRMKSATLSQIRSGSDVKPLNADAPVVSPAETGTNHRAASLPPNGPVANLARLNLEDDLPKRKRVFGKYAAKYWPAGLVAATLFLVMATVVWLSSRGNRPPGATPGPADPMLDHLVKLNVELADKHTAAERISVLSRMADELNREMRELARADATGDNMRSLEEMYTKVVLNGMVDQAKRVDQPLRKAILSEIANRLEQSAEKSEQIAKQAPEHSKKELNKAAVTARKGTVEMRRLIPEASS